MRIGIDLLGGDETPQVLFEAVLQSKLKLDPSVSFVVIGLEKPSDSSVEFIQAEEAVTMDDSPLFVVRRKRQSSMAIGIQLLKEKKIDAFVSTGNTGALVAYATLHLSLLPTITKPALLATLPTEKGRIAVLDVGAHISFKPEHLMEYAKLGALYCQIATGIASPKIGLLNIGVEEKKGTAEVKEAYFTMQKFFASHHCQFMGNVEGREVFQGKVDVLVTDGFTGNVFLKTCEGASSFLLEYLGKFSKNQESASNERKLLSHFHEKFNYEGHPGALLCGFEAVVVKCHGYSTAKALISGISGAVDLVKKDVVTKMHHALTT